jgi:phage portal protein BeeE
MFAQKSAEPPMLNLLTRLARPVPKKPPEAKASRAGAVLAFYETGRAVWTARDYAALAREGFQKNAVVHRAVRPVSEAAASLPLTLLEEGRALDAHPLLALLARPNRHEGGQRFLESVYGHLMVSGNAYVEAASVDGAPRELYALRPDRMRVAPGPDGWPAAYEYAVGAETVRFADRGRAWPRSCTSPCSTRRTTTTASRPWRRRRSRSTSTTRPARGTRRCSTTRPGPSGALIFSGAGGTPLADDQFDRLKAELTANYQGAANAGRPLLLEGGLTWQPLSLSPKDMDFLEAKNGAAREIALAFGVPPLLLGLPGDNTHANYAEANRAFYRQTVIPLAKRTAEALAAWLGPAFAAGGMLALEPDLDAIEALAQERESLWRRVGTAAFLSDDEKREAVGYGRRQTA